MAQRKGSKGSSSGKHSQSDLEFTNLDDIIDQVLQKFLNSPMAHEDSEFSQNTYHDQHILQKGSDWRREHEASPKASAKDSGQSGIYEPYGGYYAEPYGHGHDERSGFGEAGNFGSSSNDFLVGPSDNYYGTPDEVANDDGYWGAYGDPYVDAYGYPYGAPRPRDLDDPREFINDWLDPNPKVKLTPLLRQMRNLENTLDENGKPLDQGLLFVQEAKLAADYEDDYKAHAVPNVRFMPTYTSLNNRELRAYFGWRTRWRHGQAGYECDAFSKICAFELLNGVGCKDQTDMLQKLSKLGQECQMLYGWSTTTSDIHRWMEDYVLLFGLDPKLVTTEEERTFDHAAMVLRNAEKAILYKEGLLHVSADAVPPPPTDEELWDATEVFSTMDPKRSPFFREHHKEAVAVWSGVFRQMCIHCAKRRKISFTDDLLGVEFAITYTPFVGVPRVEGLPAERSFMRLTDACWFTKHKDGWRKHIALDRFNKVTEIGNLLRALDWLMREAWGYSRKLKPRKVPKYLQRYIQKECDAVLQKEAEAARKAEEAKQAEEARKRKLSIDFSKLGHIRAAAATTREALLVDEEREDYAPEGAAQAAQSDVLAAAQADGATPSMATASKDAQEPTAASTANANNVETQAGQSHPDQHPMGLTDLEYQVACRLLDGRRADDLGGPGTPTLEMLVDSINEKLFDQLGDTAFEFSEDGPAPIEDYIDDVRGILEQ
ncbi:MAG: TerB N-terminal domain-containing protein [Atopobiaceae bacterium]